MNNEVNACGDQEVCEVFACKLSTRNHHVRLVEKCLHYGQAMCPQLTGQACSIDKIRRLKGALNLNEAYHV